MDQLLKQMFLVYVSVFALTGLAMADALSDAQQASDAGNFVKAARLLKPLAVQGNAVAQFKLAMLNYKGTGVSKNHKEAARLYRLSAEQGYVPAQSNLATMYYSGTGVSQDYVLAHMWKSIAAANADSERKKRYIEQLDSLAMNMNARQIAEAKELAKKCTTNKFKGCKRK